MKPIHRVLVVEDDASIRLVLRRRLASMGCHVDVARDGNEGLALWQSRHYDLVLTDFSMPGMSGSELASRIRASKRRNAHAVPLIAITGDAEYASRGPGDAGVTECITKPFSALELQRLLRTWLPGSNGHLQQECATGPDQLSDSEIMRQVARTFVDTIPDYVQQLQRALAANSRPGIREVAHKLKSTARLVGGDEVAGLCEAIESPTSGIEIADLGDRILHALSALEQSLRCSSEAGATDKTRKSGNFDEY